MRRNRPAHAAGVAALILLGGRGVTSSAQTAVDSPRWTSPNRCRLLLQVDPGDRVRSDTPVTVSVDFQALLNGRGLPGRFDPHTIEVIGFEASGAARNPYPAPRGGEGFRLPHRVDSLFGASEVTLHFVMPDRSWTNFWVYFDTLESGRGRPRRYPGLLGDGDKFSESHGRREIAGSHFDCFVDFDGDGDLDLCKGGVEPFVSCYENLGRNRFVDRGRLASGGTRFTLPCSQANRSWLTVAFHDIDGDGDEDFFPSFGDGPEAGRIVFYRNITRGLRGPLNFERVGPLQTTSNVPLAGGAPAGGWFPSLVFARDWDGDGVGPDALVGSNHRCWLYAGRGTNAEGAPRFAEAEVVRAGGREIELINPRFDLADVDGDGDLDLFAGTQPGAVHWFQNIGGRGKPDLAPGQVVAWDGKYLIGDAHSGVKVADFDGDGLLDVVTGRFWERVDLNEPTAPRDFGGFWKNVGTRTSPRWSRRARGAPCTERFQPCDAIRQNSVRATDWDGDGRLDLLAGDTDGFIWLFKNDGRAIFHSAVRLESAGTPLNVASSGGHARFDVCDWDHDGRPDLVVADGSGTVTLFLNRGSRPKPVLAAGQRLAVAGQPIQLGARASVLVCDWDNDGREDLILADDKGYYFSRNTGTAHAPVLAAPKPVTFGGQPVRYVRPNLGSFVDWDGDGKRDLIACHFENSVRFYRNMGSGAPGAEPQFTDPEGVVILRGESPQMISGAAVVDWNGDGDLDLLTGQGHGGSGLRFYERDWIEDDMARTHPAAIIVRVEAK